MTVSVEFEKINTENHPHTNREVQLISIDPDGTYEEFEIVIDHQALPEPDGAYYICFMATATSEYYCTSEWIKDTAT